MATSTTPAVIAKDQPAEATHVHLEVAASKGSLLAQADATLYSTFAEKSPEWHDEATKRLLRKVDLRLLPVLILMYLLNFLDRR
jgi:hypothetical protein